MHKLCITVCTKATCGRDLKQGQSFEAACFCVLEMRFEGQATVKVYAKEFDALHRLNNVITNFQGWIRTNATLVIEIDTNRLGRRKFHAIRHCPSVDVIDNVLQR